MITHLVRIPDGWAAMSETGNVIAVTPLCLLDACGFFGVRRIMFGSYGINGEQREAWEVRERARDSEVDSSSE